ncbi:MULTISPECIES: SDR family NAD(P)-dependent oxidoreductase [Hydrocarboniphaga]|jgi:NAD(P)-dependent dehydrogenase (short-subunit alcohol dehydrogenase family)|uniref:Peroxisomal trans-2-enoyl-CoA reductase n=1 Tax=Hydrocarboniphaga effusa AP103 TaxID=1172194 RepID=I8TA47_9GAMM|nr:MULTISPECIES: SDR family oxidoreductase [Hydrocarboniphaga]EIT70743.1 hypothetical protein WQQ_08800 [Hydrocarboniphaga effusa AP103]MDZ4079882.1 SDR family oxidoreductase [Hydrocarboniphaga sp.]
MGRLNDKVAVICASRQDAQHGVAAGIAQRLRDEGARVALLGSPASKAEAEAAIADVLTRHGRIDILVNGADESTDFSPLASKSLAVAPSAQAVLWSLQAAYPALRERGGRVVNIVATMGDSLNRKLADGVAASEAIKSLTRSAAEEWGEHGVLVNALAVAADTAVFRKLREQAPEAVDALVAQSPMQRMGDCEADIGGAVMLLVSEAGRFLTGHVLYADGGQHLTPTPFEAIVPM